LRERGKRGESGGVNERFDRPARKKPAVIEQLKSDGAPNAAKEIEAARKKGLASVIVDGKQHHTLRPGTW
jgi:hypothetical protein